MGVRVLSQVFATRQLYRFAGRKTQTNVSPACLEAVVSRKLALCFCPVYGPICQSYLKLEYCRSLVSVVTVVTVGEEVVVKEGV